MAEPKDAQSGSPERVALDLMIWLKDTIPNGTEPNREDRAYWLNFYNECLLTTKGYRK